MTRQISAFGAAGWITVARKRSHLLLSHKISNLYRIENKHLVININEGLYTH